MLRGQGEQRMIDAVVGKDHQRTFRAQALRQDPGRRRADLPQRVGIGDGPPWHVGVGAVAEENPLRRLPRPMFEPIADAPRRHYEDRKSVV